MQIEQRQWKRNSGWQTVRSVPAPLRPQLVLYFGSGAALEDGTAGRVLREAYPSAHLLGCSTAGEICGTEVSEESVVATAIAFDDSRVVAAYRRIDHPTVSESVGEALAHDLPTDGLVHVLVLAEGINVNGSDLVKGLRRGLPANVAVTGGLAGDGERFERTLVCLDDQRLEGGVAAIGLYGRRLKVGFGSLGGWDSFGPERLVTRARGNVLYELDGDSALSLYKRYLGPHAAALPASGLLFPLSLRGEHGAPRVVRTILGVDEAAGSLIFAGDVPQGAYVSLMRANVDRLIDGAQGAAAATQEILGKRTPDLGILISCVGRKLVLRQRVEEEVESVRDHLGLRTVLSGFYSYGEIAPFSATAKCELHNQTMTITTLSEC